MLFLLFQLGSDRYALDIRHVAEVLPLVDIAPVPRLPPEVAGVLNYCGAPVPAIDLCQLTMQRPALRRLNTRIVIVHYPDESGGTRLLGLIAERATETLRCDPAYFSASGVTGAAAHHLGPVAMDANGFIQRTELNQLLPVSVREMLFHSPPELQ
jgi:chemotaxis-related protein WspB